MALIVWSRKKKMIEDQRMEVVLPHITKNCEIQNYINLHTDTFLRIILNIIINAFY